MKKTLFCVVLLINCAAAYAQAPAIQWQHTYGGSTRDESYSVIQTTDGGYITAGESLSDNGDVTGNHGGYDCWVVKSNSAGAIQWEKCYGGSGAEDLACITQTNDGGYIMVGTSGSNDGQITNNHGAGDCWVVKTDASGVIQWQRSYGGSDQDFGKFIQQTADGGYVIAGISTSSDGDATINHGALDAWIIKIDLSGNIQWQQSFGGTGDDEAYAVRQTTDGGYIFTGNTNSTDGDVTGNHGGFDYWVVKLSSAGSLQWEKTYGSAGDELAYSVQQTTDGGYIVAGTSNANGGDVTGNHGIEDDWLVKLSSSGSLQWQKSYGGTQQDEVFAVQQTTDKGYIMAGYSNSSDGDVTGYHGTVYAQYWVVKTDSAGMLQWQKCMGGTAGDGAQAIEQTADGGYIVAGSSNSFDGDVTGNHGTGDYWVVKLEGPATGIAALPQASILSAAYPNPTHNVLHITAAGAWHIADVGRRVVASGNGVTELNTASWAAGTYLLYTGDGPGQKITKE